MHYVIVRCTYRHEREVAKAIQAMGLDAWLPMETRWTLHKRKTKHARLWEVPAIPTILFAAIPSALHGDLQRIRYYEGIGRDSASLPILIPHSQLAVFMDHLETHNRRAANLYRIATQGRQTIKPIKIRLGAGVDGPDMEELAATIKSAIFATRPVDNAQKAA